MPELTGALDLAIELAKSAGAMIREDFHRLGGPRGHYDHAEVDTEAEQMIRAHLLESFPDWGYRGEETGSTNLDHAPRYVWLVDPNDGTRSYLDGYRGNAVSIALLRDREPVLGVVYAPCCPDDDGDLITWADGCGPLRRNGAEVVNERWPERLEAHGIVIVAIDADNEPSHNLEIIRPARYRPMPSIAYRLALAAAGDGIIGAGLKGAGDWDYAAGQALLRGADADMFDEHGEAASYSAQGQSHCRACFGGAPLPIQQLISRPYREFYPRRRRHDPTGLMHPWLSLPPGDHVADPGLVRRAQGCILGQLAGDSLGSLVEFQSAATIAQRYPNGELRLEDGGTYHTLAGQPTDDSELALMLARAVERMGTYDAEMVARAYGYWIQSAPFDIGSTTAQALSPIPPVVMPLIPRGAAHQDGGGSPVGRYAADVARRAANGDSQANGSLMRVSPLGIFGHAMDPDALAEIAREDSRLTHPNQVCQDACAIYVVAIAHAIASKDAPSGVYRFARTWAERSSVAPSVVDALTAAEHAAPADFMTNQGWVLTALQNAFHQLLHAGSAEAGIVATVRCGGDTDTNAAIAGALLGAVHGRESIPRAWRNLVLTCRPVAGAPGVHRPRPAPFWPVDALELAERLLIAGSA